MPLLDHFHGPTVEDLPWESFGTMWVAAVTAEINRKLPRGRFRAFADRPDESHVEVWIADCRDRHQRVAVVRFVGPANKRESAARATFVARSQFLLDQRLGLVVVDIVTQPAANLHNELMRRIWDAQSDVPGPIYSASYCTQRRDGRDQMAVWSYALEVGRPLPAVPVPLPESIMVPLDLEATYETALVQSGA